MDHNTRETVVHSGLQRFIRDDTVNRRRKVLLGYYDYTVILTYFGMLSAFSGILCAINEQFRKAVICLLIAGCCDLFDGAVASTKERTKSEKCFGIQIDSFSDLISFGVLPAVFLYMFSGKSGFSAASAALYTLLALIRLSFFNVTEEERQDSTNSRRTDFQGIPVTTAAMVLPLVYLMYTAGLFVNIQFFTGIMLMLGCGFISIIKIKKPQKTGKIVMLLIGLAETIGICMIK
ncbi:MAG: CDP-alcohol phosphatidyltransferase family protein [Oscillospiraceae bacterium]|nr:CDP-alcohol phosphatidyltransferase family protein [Oscillospiraceae bacterium]